MAVINYTPEEETKIQEGRPRLYKTPEEMQKLIDLYFQDCEAKEIPLTMSGLAYSLGMDRKTLLNYSHRDEFLLTLKRARERIELEYEQRLIKSGTPTVGLIFALKNNAGWQDKRELDANVSLTVVDLLSALDTDSEVADK